jgi:hypothetical protein
MTGFTIVSTTGFPLMYSTAGAADTYSTVDGLRYSTAAGGVMYSTGAVDMYSTVGAALMYSTAAVGVSTASTTEYDIGGMGAVIDPDRLINPMLGAESDPGLSTYRGTCVSTTVPT